MKRISLYSQTLRAVSSLAIIVGMAATATADVTLPAVFSDNMVLQRDREIPVWGWADAGEKVDVSLADKQATATADKDGRWSVRLDPLSAGGPHTLKVQGANTLAVEEVLVGEVWLCSGQSNMAMQVRRALNADEEAADADYPQIRMFTVPRGGAAEPQQQIKGSWAVCSPETVGGFSATAYFFGRRLHQELDVPVGLINSSVGGTPIDFWTSAEAQQAMFQEPKVAADGKRVGMTEPMAGAGNLYNAMIAPLAPYAIRGAIWYQGERNSRGEPAYLYRHQLPAMIGNWRKLWGQGDFPFLFVQLPNFTKPQTEPVEPTGWVTVREGMAQTLRTTPNTGMAVTLDVGEAGDIHPKNKQAVGQRLARWALATTYEKSLVPSGPLFESAKIEGGKVVIHFKHVGEGLVAQGGEPLSGFAVAGDDGKFVRAEARIDGDTVVVSSSEIPQPAAARYAWAPNPDCNLFNKDGLPAEPFRTDDWK
ncbi:MAG: sialate O-acetylesterase [Pirellulaceae bacterium]